jgi:hypothetical protein
MNYSNATPKYATPPPFYLAEKTIANWNWYEHFTNDDQTIIPQLAKQIKEWIDEQNPEFLKQHIEMLIIKGCHPSIGGDPFGKFHFDVIFKHHKSYRSLTCHMYHDYDKEKQSYVFLYCTIEVGGEKKYAVGLPDFDNDKYTEELKTK